MRREPKSSEMKSAMGNSNCDIDGFNEAFCSVRLLSILGSLLSNYAEKFCSTDGWPHLADSNSYKHIAKIVGNEQHMINIFATSVYL